MKKTLTTFTHKAFCTARRARELIQSGVLELELRWEKEAECSALRSCCSDHLLFTLGPQFHSANCFCHLRYQCNTLTKAGCTSKTGDVNICTHNWKRNSRVTLGVPFLWIFYFHLFNHESMWHLLLSPHHTNPVEPLHLPVCVRVFLLLAVTLRQFPRVCNLFIQILKQASCTHTFLPYSCSFVWHCRQTAAWRPDLIF